MALNYKRYKETSRTPREYLLSLQTLPKSNDSSGHGNADDATAIGRSRRADAGRGTHCRKALRRASSSCTRLAAVGLLCLGLTGCMVLPIGAAKVLSTEQTDNAVKLIRESNGKGCIYARGGVVAGVGQGAVDVVGTIGQDLEPLDCLDRLRSRPEM